MYLIQNLHIRGYRDELVPNTFYKQDHPSSHVAFLLPGMGYTSHMPLLFYTGRCMLAMGADVLSVEYDYNRREDFMALGGEDRKQWLIKDVTRSCDALLGGHSYEKVTLVGKSLGTRAMGYLLREDAKFSHARAIWLTPLLRSEGLRKQIQQSGQRSLFVIGTADPHYDQTHLDAVQRATKGEILVIEGADHSLEIEGDVLRSLEILENVIRAIQAFLRS